MTHTFAISLSWRNSPALNGETLRDYSRDAEMTALDHHSVGTSAAGGFGGDTSRWNPEELLMGALSQCHMLSFLWAAQQAGITVVSYEDSVSGEMEMRAGAGSMTTVTLHPVVTVASDDEALLVAELHDQAKAMCVIRSSVNFPVLLESSARVSPPHVH